MCGLPMHAFQVMRALEIEARSNPIGKRRMVGEVAAGLFSDHAKRKDMCKALASKYSKFDSVHWWFGVLMLTARDCALQL